MSSPNIEYVTREFDFKRYGSLPKVHGDHTPRELWNIWEERAFKLIRRDLDEGWEVDQSAWGPSCLNYRYVSGGMGDWDIGNWIAYILLSVATFGIGFLILPFVMRPRYIEIMGMTVRLRRRRST